jgi:adenylate cyclase class 2
MTNTLNDSKIEVEAKVYITNEDEFAHLKSSLLSKNFKALIEHQETDYYYNSPVRDFRQTDEALRIRKIKVNEIQNDKKLEITWKGPKLDSKLKTREELTITIKDTSISVLKHFLCVLGFLDILEVRKRRESFKKEDTTVSLDRVDKLGLFMEVEILSTASKVKNASTKLVKLLCDLIPDYEERNIRRSYLELLIEKNT